MKNNKSDATKLTHSTKGGERHHGAVNVPVYHVSTIVSPTVSELLKANNSTDPNIVTYGRRGTPTTFSFQDAVAELEGGGNCIALPSGLCAISTALIGVLKAGDHLLMVDTVYEPVRKLCDGLLKSFDIETTYYDPNKEIGTLIENNTKAIFLESPGSLTFEMQDILSICQEARSIGATTIMDNTWATPLYCKPLKLGVDVSIQSATKYIGGHSDLMMGTITSSGAIFERIQNTAFRLGLCVSPDDCYLAMRGMKSLLPRLERHTNNALKLIDWLMKRPEVKRILYPPLPEDPGHALWKRDYTGASGLFGLILFPKSNKKISAMLDGLELFSLGYSWGGHESLIITTPTPPRTVTPWTEDGHLLRISAGLEDPADLINDLKHAFLRLNA